MERPGLITRRRKGVVEYCVLAGREHYGYELVQTLSRVDGMLVTEGTVYPVLSRLKRDGLVETEWRESREGPPRKYYRLTRPGRAALDDFRAQWRAFSRAMVTSFAVTSSEASAEAVQVAERARSPVVASRARPGPRRWREE